MLKFLLRKFIQKSTVAVVSGLLLWGCGLLGALADVRHLADAQTFLKVHEAQTVFVDAYISTWKPRGVMYWDVQGSLMTKLAEVGFTIVREKSEPHDLILRVDYEERRGHAFAVNRYGTIIEGTFQVVHQAEGPLFAIHVIENSEPSVMGTPPYLDVLHNFLSNPYYHFLGEIVRDEIQGSQDPHKIFINSLHADVGRLQNAEADDPVLGDAGRLLHSMAMAKSIYAPVAAWRPLEELVNVRDARLVGILKDMLQYPDGYVQVRTVEAFGDFEVREALPFLKELRTKKLPIEVQLAIQRTIELLKSSPQ